MNDQSHEDAIQKLLARPEVDYIQVRDKIAGCYDFRIERANPCDVAPEAKEFTR